MAKEGTSRKHVNSRSWKLIRNADVNISSSIPAALTSVEDLNPLDGDRSAVVDGNPGCRFLFSVADEPPTPGTASGPSVSPSMHFSASKSELKVDDRMAPTGSNLSPL